MFFLDPVTLDVVSKVKLPSYTKNGLEINDYNCFLDNMDIFIVNKYLKISPRDKKTNRQDAEFIYNIENNEYIKQFSTETTNHFNSDESLFISYSTGGFDIYNTEDWSKIYTFRTEYKYFEDEFEYRYLDYIVEHIAFSPDGSRIALSIYKETEEERDRIEIFNLITKEFEESFQIENIEGVSKALGKARTHFVDNETLIIKRENGKRENLKTFLYKLNTNGNLIEFPQQNIETGNFIDLDNIDILCNNLGGSHYSRINVTPELLTSVEENTEQTIYPNPTTGNLTYEFNSNLSGMLNWQIVDLQSQVMLAYSQHFPQGENNLQINISTLPVGTYFLNVGNNSVKIILEK